MLKYDDWLKREDFSSLDLALLMAGTAPDWGLGIDILEMVQDDHIESYSAFEKRYSHMQQLWGVYEKFERARSLIFKSQHGGLLSNRTARNKAGRIPRDAAIAFVVDEDAKKHSAGDSYDVFLIAAKDNEDSAACKKKPLLNSQGLTAPTIPWWQEDHNIDEMIRVKAEACRENKTNLQNGKPSKQFIAREISDTINAIEKRGGRARTIGDETIRNYLKNREI